MDATAWVGRPGGPAQGAPGGRRAAGRHPGRCPARDRRL